MANADGASPLTLGTAGHVDHGKTALVGALTGVDTDRLPEEKQRGLSIDLGYAPLALPSGRRLSLVDVPGHQRFVRTMVAGATGIDCFLLTVAADDGVMPQTREHARVLAALGVREGVVAVTKCDAADPGRAIGEARALVPGSELVAVSAREGTGMAELFEALERMAARLPGRARDPGGEPRLHVDRSFTVKGAGTVVTGTLWSGAVARGDHVALVGREGSHRVRAVHLHGQEVERAHAGQRVALNLVGLSRNDVSRGDVVAGPGTGLRPTRSLVADLALDEEVDDGERVQVHHGTRESPARVRRRPQGGFAVRLEQLLMADTGDRLVVRRIAPPGTLGGGTVLDPHPAPASRSVPARRQPAAPAGPPPVTGAALELESRLLQAGLAPAGDHELAGLEAELAALREDGRIVRVGRALHFHATVVDEVAARVRAHLEEHPDITIAQLRDLLGTSRRYAQALLEHFDAEGLTIRRGDVHVLRRRHRSREKASP